MSRGLEILRRLLLTVGALVASVGFMVAAWVAFSTRVGADDPAAGAVGMLCAAGGFYGWRALINWILMHETE